MQAALGKPRAVFAFLLCGGSIGVANQMSMNFSFIGGSPEEILAQTDRLFARAENALLGAINSLQAGEMEAGQDIERTSQTMMRALGILVMERANIEKLGRKIAGAVGTGTLDLHGARDEIGRRLACLRDA